MQPSSAIYPSPRHNTCWAPAKCSVIGGIHAISRDTEVKIDTGRPGTLHHKQKSKSPEVARGFSGRAIDRREQITMVTSVNRSQVGLRSVLLQSAPVLPRMIRLTRNCSCLCGAIFLYSRTLVRDSNDLESNLYAYRINEHSISYIFLNSDLQSHYYKSRKTILSIVCFDARHLRNSPMSTPLDKLGSNKTVSCDGNGFYLSLTSSGLNAYSQRFEKHQCASIDVLLDLSH